MAQGIKGLPCKHEELSSNPKNSGIADTELCVCNPGARGDERWRIVGQLVSAVHTGKQRPKEEISKKG